MRMNFPDRSKCSFKHTLPNKSRKNEYYSSKVLDIQNLCVILQGKNTLKLKPFRDKGGDAYAR